MSLGLHFIHLHRKTIIHKKNIKIKRTIVIISSDQVCHRVTFPHSSFVSHFIASYLA